MTKLDELLRIDGVMAAGEFTGQPQSSAIEPTVTCRQRQPCRALSSARR